MTYSHLQADYQYSVQRDQLQAQCSVTSMGSLYLFLSYTTIILAELDGDWKYYS